MAALGLLLPLGCGGDATQSSAGNTEVSFLYPDPVNSCDVDFEIYRAGTTPDTYRFESGDCYEVTPDDQGSIGAIMDLPAGEFTVEIWVDQPPDSYCTGQRDFVVEEGQSTEVEVVVTCGFSRNPDQ